MIRRMYRWSRSRGQSAQPGMAPRLPVVKTRLVLPEHPIVPFRLLLLSLLAFLVGFSAVGHAQLSPGPLSNAHRELDSPLQCAQCHVFGGGQPIFVCSECHTEIASRVAGKNGYHATVVDRAQQGRDCAKCHREHVGRSFQLIHWPKGQENFDHDETGYQLVGAHGRQKCRDCHQYDFIDLDVLREAKVQDPARSFLGLSTTCGVCHKDEHRGQLSAECDSCHNFESWQDVSKFQHADTEFPLTGRHRDVECLECHPRENGFAKYKEFGMTACKSCHEDPHQGAFQFQTCASCHSTGGWELVKVSSSFDHARTDFPLLGKHADVRCRECHVNAEFAAPVAHVACLDCHDEDPHGGQFDSRQDKGDCAACHTEEGFIPTTFTKEGHKATEYPLVGKHAEVECKSCHEPRGAETLYRVPFAQCVDCHEDSHEGEFDDSPYAGRCEECHQVDGFHPSSFTITRHKETRFPLVGSHLATPCVRCHEPPEPGASAALAPFHFESLGCAKCHDHPHREQFATASPAAESCETCHDLNVWTRLKSYDHARTEFPLKGEHRTVGCADCHTRADGVPGFDGVVFGDAPQQCSGCHEDVHDGQFDQGARSFECSVCHTNLDWRPTEFDHDEYSTFSLDGSHDDVPCKMCHTEVKTVDDYPVRIYRGTPRKCVDCHEGDL